MTQFGRPDSDISVGAWSPYPADPTTLFDKINEETPNGDTDYIHSDLDEEECEVGLTNVNDPEIGTGHKIRCYAKSPSGGGAKEQMTIALVENGNVRGTSPAANVDRTVYGLIEYTLSEAEANSIGNYANLRLRFHITKVNGGEPIRITQAEFECPDATEEHSGSSSISGNGSLAGVAKKGGKQSSLISAKGALVAVGLVALLGISSIFGGGELIATGEKATQGDAAISGGGAIATTGTRSEGEPHSGSAAVSGNGAIAAQGEKGAEEAGAVPGGGEILSSGEKGGEGIAEVTGNGSIIAAGTKDEAEAYSGSAAVSGGGTVSAEGEKGAEESPVVSGNGDAAAIGERGAFSSASVSGTGALASDGIKETEGTGLISGNGAISAAGEKKEGESHDGSAAISGGGEIVSTAKKRQMATGSQVSRKERDLLLIGTKKPVFLDKKKITFISDD